MLEAAESMARDLPPEQFDALLDGMAMDRNLTEDTILDDPEVPSAPEDLPRLKQITNFPTFEP